VLELPVGRGIHPTVVVDPHVVHGVEVGTFGALVSLPPAFLGRLLRVDLIKCVSNVRLPIRTSVRLSTKSFFDFNQIWCVGRGRVRHDGMQYDPIHGQRQGHEPFKVVNLVI